MVALSMRHFSPTTPHALGAPVPIARMTGCFMLVNVCLGRRYRASAHTLWKLRLPFCFCPSLWLLTSRIWRTFSDTIINNIVWVKFNFRSYRVSLSALPLLYLPGP